MGCFFFFIQRCPLTKLIRFDFVILSIMDFIFSLDLVVPKFLFGSKQVGTILFLFQKDIQIFLGSTNHQMGFAKQVYDIFFCQTSPRSSQSYWTFFGYCLVGNNSCGQPHFLLAPAQLVLYRFIQQLKFPTSVATNFDVRKTVVSHTFST